MLLTIRELEKSVSLDILAMEKKSQQPAPGDGLRSLRSTMLFRAINYELYIKPNKNIMIFGAITMLSCIGYIIYMRYNYDKTKYYLATKSDGTAMFKHKVSKWEE